MLKPPPHDLESEMALLGAMIIDNSRIRIVGNSVREEDFYNVRHRHVFRTIMEMNIAAEPVDIVTLNDALETRGLLEKAGGCAYLATLVESTPTPLNAETYARNVAEKARLRKLSEMFYNLQRAAHDAGEMSSTIVEKAITALKNIIIPVILCITDIGKLCQNACEIFTERYNSGGGLIGLSTGFPILDRMTSGLRSKNLIIVAGRPGHGKTSFALQVGDFSVKQGKRVLYISLEMPSDELIFRLVSQRTGIDGDLINRGETSEWDTGRVINCFNEISKSGWTITDKPGQTIEDIEFQIFAEHYKKPLDLVILDYVQLIRHDPKEQRYRAIGRAAEVLYGIAKQLNIPVVLCSQLGRAAEENPKRRPRLSDLRESGDLEQHASLVIFIHRPALNGVKCPKEDTQFLIRKNRHGNTGTVYAVMELETTTFKESLKEKQDDETDN